MIYTPLLNRGPAGVRSPAVSPADARERDGTIPSSLDNVDAAQDTAKNIEMQSRTVPRKP
jgi:hypothetical protein